MSQITFIYLSDLNMPEFEAHQDVSHDDLKDLADSIKTYGVIEPLIVRTTDSGIEIVAGCLRYRASLISGLQAVPCINMTLDPQAAEIIKIHENIKRIPLNHIDQGKTFIMMMDNFKMTEEAIAKVVMRSIAYVSQHVSLVRLGNELTIAVKTGTISFSQARELMRVPDPTHMKSLLHYCKNDGATVNTIKGWVNDYLRESTSPHSRVPDDSPDTPPFETPKSLRPCAACEIPTDISKLRVNLYCIPCDNAIRNALNEQKAKHPPNST